MEPEDRHGWHIAGTTLDGHSLFVCSCRPRAFLTDEQMRKHIFDALFSSYGSLPPATPGLSKS